jgi:hypothetical protein
MFSSTSKIRLNQMEPDLKEQRRPRHRPRDAYIWDQVEDRS